MAARDFDAVEAMTQDWRAAMDAATKTTPRPPVALGPLLRARLHVERGLDAGRITDGLGERIAAEATEYLRSQR